MGIPDDGCWLCGAPGARAGTAGRFFCPACEVKWTTAEFWAEETYAEYLKVKSRTLAGRAKLFDVDLGDFPGDTPHP